MISNEEYIQRVIDNVKQLFQHTPFSQSDFSKKENETKTAYLGDKGNCFGIGVEYTRRVINSADRPDQKSTIEKLNSSHLKKDSNLAHRIALYQIQTQEYLRKNKEKYQIDVDTTDIDAFFDTLLSRLNQSSVQALNSKIKDGGGGHTFLFRKEGDEYIVFDSNLGEFKTRDIGELKSAFEKMRSYYNLLNINFTNVDLYDVKQLVEDLGIARKGRNTEDGTYKVPKSVSIINATYETVRAIFNLSTPQEIQNLAGYDKGSALVNAITNKDVRLVELFLDNGIQFSKDHLLIAVVNGSDDIVKKILSKGFILENTDRIKLIKVAVINGDIEVFKSLLDSSNKLDDANIIDCIRLASGNKHFELMSVLLGPEFEIQDKMAYTPAMNEILKEGEINVDIFERIINQFIDRGAIAAYLNFYRRVDNNSDSPLMTVMYNCGDDTVKRFIEAGADVDDYNRETKDSALGVAISSDRADVIQMLVDNGIDVNKSLDMQGYEIPPTLYAASINSLKSFDKLLSLGGNLDAELTSVYFASAIGHENAEMISRLIELGMDVNVELNGGGTALNKSVESGHVEITQKLLEAGADVTVLKEEDIKKASPEIQKLISDHNDKLVEKEAASSEKKKPGHVDRLVAYHDKRIDERRPDKPQKKSGHAAKVEETRSADSKSRQ